jgi:hypothetical protein
VESAKAYAAASAEYSRTVEFEFEGPVRRERGWSLIIFVDSGSGDTLALDLNPQ